ncbi:MAG: PKD domain-containing protein [Candidatus Diapherotrites archaeon]
MNKRILLPLLFFALLASNAIAQETVTFAANDSEVQKNVVIPLGGKITFLVQGSTEAIKILVLDQDTITPLADTGWIQTNSYTYDFGNNRSGMYYYAVSVKSGGTEKKVGKGLIIVKYTGAFQIEAGTTMATGTWQKVNLTRSFVKPVVIVKSVAGCDDPAEAKGLCDFITPRVRNATSTSFEIMLQDTCGGNFSGQLEVPYIVVEEGRHKVSGFDIEAGKTTAWGFFLIQNTPSAFHWFNPRFEKEPVLITTISSFNGPDPVTTRNKTHYLTIIPALGITLPIGDFRDGFVSILDEPGWVPWPEHRNEEVSYLAITPGIGMIDGRRVVVQNGDLVSHIAKKIEFQGVFDKPPVIIADMQRINGGDWSIMRYANLTKDSAKLYVAETNRLLGCRNGGPHTMEPVGYVLMGEGGTMPACNAFFTTNPDYGEPPLAVKFDASGSIGNIQSYQWTFGDGGTGTGKEVTHVYNNEGEFTAKLKITCSGGETSETQKTIKVEKGINAPLAAAIQADKVKCVAPPCTINFDGSKSTGKITNYDWNFGDGTPNQSGPDLKQVSHTFNQYGKFIVTLTVSDATGNKASATIKIIVGCESAADCKCGDGCYMGVCLHPSIAVNKSVDQIVPFKGSEKEIVTVWTLTNVGTHKAVIKGFWLPGCEGYNCWIELVDAGGAGKKVLPNPGTIPQISCESTASTPAPPGSPTPTPSATCQFNSCEQANPQPCWCGTVLSPSTHPWCCTSGTFSGISDTQEGCKQNPPCSATTTPAPTGPVINSVSHTPEPLVQGSTTTFTVSGTNIEQIKIKVWDLTSITVFESAWVNGTSFTWNGKKNDGTSLRAAGYVYKVYARKGTQEVSSETKNLTIAPAAGASAPEQEKGSLKLFLADDIYVDCEPDSFYTKCYCNGNWTIRQNTKTGQMYSKEWCDYFCDPATAECNPPPTSTGTPIPSDPTQPPTSSTGGNSSTTITDPNTGTTTSSGSSTTTSTDPVTSSTTTSSGRRVSPCPPYGDVFIDGFVDVTDGRFINEFLLGARTLTEQQKKNADVDNDGSITASDKILVSYYAVGIVSTFPVCSSGGGSGPSPPGPTPPSPSPPVLPPVSGLLIIEPMQTVRVIQHVENVQPPTAKKDLNLGLVVSYTDEVGLGDKVSESKQRVKALLANVISGLFNVKFKLKDQNTCVGWNDMYGLTGKHVAPKVLFDWSFTSDDNSPVSINQCDKKLSGDFVFCDATQFSIELLKKLNKINKIASSSGLGVAELTEFEAFLMNDNFSTDFRRDFDHYYTNGFFSTPAWYKDLPSPWSSYFLDLDRLKFLPAKISEPGLYKVKLEFAFDGESFKFFTAGKPSAKITVKFEKVHGVGVEVIDSPFYRLPFNGLVGTTRVDEDGKTERKDYGIGFNNQSGPLPIATYNNNLVSTVAAKGQATYLTSKKASFEQLNLTERGQVLVIGPMNEIVLLPSYPMPVLLGIESVKGKAQAFYLPFQKNSVYGSQSPYLSFWTGIAASDFLKCRDFQNNPLPYNQGDSKTTSLANVCKIQDAKDKAYGFMWDYVSKDRERIFLKTIFYSAWADAMAVSPACMDSNESVSIIASKSAVAWGTNQSVPLQEAGYGVDDFKAVVDRIATSEICFASDSSGKYTFFWNPQKIEENLEAAKKLIEANWKFNWQNYVCPKP